MSFRVSDLVTPAVNGYLEIYLPSEAWAITEVTFFIQSALQTVFISKM